jgi:predicted DNA-binding transcriptional regulator YafY
LTADRCARLFKLLSLLVSPQKREVLLRRLRIDVRGFYRDVESLKKLGIDITIDDGRYRLNSTVDAALTRLPFPDPQLTCADARILAKGRTAAHRKLKEQLERLMA